MKKLYLLALPLSLTIGANANVSLSNPWMNILDGITIYPNGVAKPMEISSLAGFDQMKVMAGYSLDEDMFFTKDGNPNYFSRKGTPSTKTFQTDVLKKDMSWKTGTVNSNKFSSTLEVIDGDGEKTGEKIKMQAAIIKIETHPTMTDSIVMNFGAVYPWAGNNAVKLINSQKNTLLMRLRHSTGGKAVGEMEFGFTMLCAKHPTLKGKKVNSIVCDEDHFKPYGSNDLPFGTALNKYQVANKYVSNAATHPVRTIAFVPDGIQVPAGAKVGAGSYSGHLQLTFTVE